MNTDDVIVSPGLDRKIKDFPWLWQILNDWSDDRVEVRVTNFPSTIELVEFVNYTRVYVFASDKKRKHLQYLDSIGASRENSELLLGRILVSILNDQATRWQKKNLKYFCMFEKGNNKRKHVITIFRHHKTWRDYQELFAKREQYYVGS